MNCMKDAIVLSANPYAFTDEQTGEVRRGVTVYYVSSLTPSVDENGAKGVAPTKANFNHSLFSNFTEVPGIYDINFEVVPGSGGRTRIKYTDAAFKKKVV